MKEKALKATAALLASFVFLLMAAGSGSDGSTTSKVSIEESQSDASNTPSDADEEESDTSSEQSDMSYEITDTSFTYYENSIGRLEYYGYVEILNTGSTNIYMDDCTFDLEDDNGHLLQSDTFISSCPDIIAPGEKGYYYNGIGSSYIDESVSLDNGIKLVPQYTLEVGRGEIVDYEVTDTDMRTDDYGNIKITGRITNSSEEDDSMVYIQIILYDNDGKVLAITGTNVMDLTVGSTKSFEASTLFANEEASSDNVAEYTVIARKSHYQW